MSTSTSDGVSTETVSTPADVISSEQMSTGYSENGLTLVYIKKRYNLLGHVCVIWFVIKTITILLSTIMCRIIYLVHNLFKRPHCSVKN
jgi:hypothetical protein